MTDRKKAQERTAALVALRKKHEETVTRTQERVKEQNAFRKLLRTALKQGPMSVPDLARTTDLPPEQVLWHITAMRKYDLLMETGLDEAGEYYLYGLPEEAGR
jgi:predicted HTH transcriptional regulator